MRPRVLLLEDDDRLARSLAREFSDHGYEPEISKTLSEIEGRCFEFALLDIRLAGEFGLDAIPRLLESSPGCRIVVLSGYGSIATAVEAIKRGAADYLTKPASFELIENALRGRKPAAGPARQRPSLSQVEHEYIDFVLTKNEGNISRTAKDLGIHRQSLQRKLKKYT